MIEIFLKVFSFSYMILKPHAQLFVESRVSHESQFYFHSTINSFYNQNKSSTRMHSSRMRADRRLDHISGGGRGGVYPIPQLTTLQQTPSLPRQTSPPKADPPPPCGQMSVAGVGAHVWGHVLSHDASDVPTPAPLSTDRHLWKHYLPATSFSGSRNEGNLPPGNVTLIKSITFSSCSLVPL